MAGKSPVVATDEQKTALKALASGADRAEADRARAVLTLDGWTSDRIAQAFGVREDTVRLWRSDFMHGGDRCRSRRRPRCVLLNRFCHSRWRIETNWTLARLVDEIAVREHIFKFRPPEIRFPSRPNTARAPCSASMPGS